MQGSYSIEQALQQLLSGSGMSWHFSDARTVTLRKADAAPQAVNLKPIEVSVASRTSTAISEIPGTVWVVDQQQLREQIDSGVSLKEAIGKLVPGLDLAPEGRTNYGQNMRGRNVLVMIDGSARTARAACHASSTAFRRSTSSASKCCLAPVPSTVVAPPAASSTS